MALYIGVYSLLGHGVSVRTKGHTSTYCTALAQKVVIEIQLASHVYTLKKGGEQGRSIPTPKKTFLEKWGEEMGDSRGVYFGGLGAV